MRNSISVFLTECLLMWKPETSTLQHSGRKCKRCCNQGHFPVRAPYSVMNGFLITSIVPVGYNSVSLENSIKSSFTVFHLASNIQCPRKRLRVFWSHDRAISKCLGRILLLSLTKSPIFWKFLMAWEIELTLELEEHICCWWVFMRLVALFMSNKATSLFTVLRKLDSFVRLPHLCLPAFLPFHSHSLYPFTPHFLLPNILSTIEYQQFRSIIHTNSSLILG